MTFLPNRQEYLFYQRRVKPTFSASADILVCEVCESPTADNT